MRGKVLLHALYCCKRCFHLWDAQTNSAFSIAQQCSAVLCTENVAKGAN